MDLITELEKRIAESDLKAEKHRENSIKLRAALTIILEGSEKVAEIPASKSLSEKPLALIRTRIRQRPSVAKICELALRDTMKPMHLDALASAVMTKLGKNVTPINLSSTLSREKTVFHPLGRKMWGLKEWNSDAILLSP